LNLKKSWHTGLASNQAKVWEAEQKALKERKLVDQLRREREEERQIEEIAKLAEANGGTKRTNRVDWMYTGAAAGSTGTTEEQEAFLLGKRRVDTILKREDAKQLEKAPLLTERDPTKDIANKVSLDPLLLIERQKQDALEKAMAVEVNIQKRKHKSSHKRRHRSRDRSRSRDRRDRHDKHDSHYTTSHSNNRTRSDSPRRRHSRSDSPRSRRHSPSRRRFHEKSDHRHSRRQSERYDRPRHNRPDPPRVNNPSEEEQQAKLAAMRADATNLEDDRSRRLAALEAKDAEEREREERKRDRGGNFKSTLYQQTESIGLGDRLKNARRSQLT